MWHCLVGGGLFSTTPDTMHFLPSLSQTNMIAAFPSLPIPPARPSRQVSRAAQNAATSQHAMVNLIRLVQCLASRDISFSEEWRSAGGGVTQGTIAFKRDWEVCALDYIVSATAHEGSVCGVCKGSS